MSTVYIEGIGDALPIDNIATTLVNLLVGKGLTVIDARSTPRGGVFVELRNGVEADRAIKLLHGAMIERRRVRAVPARSGWEER